MGAWSLSRSRRGSDRSVRQGVLLQVTEVIGAIRFQVGRVFGRHRRQRRPFARLKYCSPWLLSPSLLQRLEKEERERKRREKLRLKEEAKMKEEVDLYDRGLSARLGKLS